jgi:hypothetical protein
LTIAQGGLLTCSGWIFANAVVNAGVIRVVGPNGAQGTLTIKEDTGLAGNYTQTATGELDLRLQGGGATLADQLIVQGQASLGGLLQVTAVNYTPRVGDRFAVISWGSLDPNNSDFNAIGVPQGMSAAPDQPNKVYAVTA